jgi:hypothetical protein
MKLTRVINNEFTLAYCNGHYYVYTVTVVGNNIHVNFDRVGGEDGCNSWGNWEIWHLYI